MLLWDWFDRLVAFSMWMFAEGVITADQLRRWFGWYLDLSQSNVVIEWRMWQAVEFVGFIRLLVMVVNRVGR